MDECVICSKHKNMPTEPIYESDNFVVIHYLPQDIDGKMYKGHLFIEPKKHVTTPAGLSASEGEELGRLMVLASKALAAVVEFEHLYTFNIGHQVKHLHFHLVPRYPGTPKEHWGGLTLHEWPDAPVISKAEIEELSNKLKVYFSN